MTTDKGRFVWFDLMTSDVDAGIAFYTETIGWKTMPFEGGDKPYTMFCVGDEPIGGVTELPPEAAAMNIPPNWLGSIRVEDVDACVAKATSLGGKVLRDAWDIPTVGRIAVLRDPQGAAFNVFCPLEDMPRHNGAPRPGDTSWNELNTTDYESAWTFYSALFGWKATEAMDMGEDMGTYFMFQREGAEGSMGGMSSMAKVMNLPPHWLHYTTVDDLDAAIERVVKGGGKVLNGPMDVPGGDRIAQCMDPQGAAFALHWHKA